MLRKVIKHAKVLFSIKNRKFQVVLLGTLLVGIFVVGNFAFASDPDMTTTIVQFLNRLLFFIVAGLGWVLMKIFALIVIISSYNDFVVSKAVTKGWVLVRDVCNMLFVVMLLVIAFAQILNVEKYPVKKMLPKLIIAAVLVNFSKLICGLMIDFAQVVMMTFVNGYQATAGANLIQGLGINKLMQLNEKSSDIQNPVDHTSIFIALFLAAMLLVIAIFVTVMVLGLFVMRIVTLWILVVLSPVAFAMNVFPDGMGKKMKDKWWGEFTSAVVIGPVMAFFLWLSLLIMSDPAGMYPDKHTEIENKSEGGVVSNISYVDNLAQFAIALAMLMASLSIAGELGGAMGSAASKKSGQASSFAKKAISHGTGYSAARSGVKALPGGIKKGWQNERFREARHSAKAAIKKAPAVVIGGAAGGLAAAGKAVKDGKGIKAAGSAMVSGAREGGAYQMKHGTAGRADLAAKKQMKQARLDNKQKEAAKVLEGMDVTTPEEAQKVAGSKRYSKHMRKAAAMVAAKKGYKDVKDANGNVVSTVADQARQHRELFKGDKEGLKAHKETMQKRQAYAAYDLTDKKEAKAFRGAADRGEFDLAAQEPEAYKNEDFLEQAYEVTGPKQYQATMERASNRGLEYKEAVKTGNKKFAGGKMLDHEEYLAKGRAGVLSAQRAVRALPTTASTNERTQAAQKVTLATASLAKTQKDASEFRAIAGNITDSFEEGFGARDSRGRVVERDVFSSSPVDGVSSDSSGLDTAIPKIKGADLGKRELSSPRAIQAVSEHASVSQMSKMADAGEEHSEDNIDKVTQHLMTTVRASLPAPATPTYAVEKKKQDVAKEKLGRMAANDKIINALKGQTADDMKAFAP
ncbi:ABC transporter ATP-binding protein [Candidatus Kuenenbacteria bacterium]|nr:ABC transporter ATP-binding protein [Candidatus Kuenenbacteria bacterium]